MSGLRVDRRAVAAVCGMLGPAAAAVLPLVDALWGLDMTWFLVLGVLGAVTRLPGMTALEACCRSG